ncbi:GbsR/MarR family transcriptional regulator [Sanyastnella coralliicola]|uniref:GbsR/MarR family transcriptional regulator n=1 Tax=Sanyastnella coralliicola TaxID=3069118 RepID=UPI0027B96A83|nr:MarR family transcriptional regulator [Longitalea sp. SCSIO 12813]
MELKEAKEQFIMSWGALGSNWGVSKTMAQVHALLMVSNDPLSADEVMEQLNISRGNANMNLRALIDWGLVEKIHKLGERREFFQAEKDMWKIATRIASERRKRELQPILKVIDQMKDIEDKQADKAELEAFKKQMTELENFTGRVDRIFDRLDRADERWFTGLLTKIMKR